MTQLTADFEAGVAGNNVLVTDPGSANAWDASTIGGGTLTYDSTHPAFGSLAMKLASVTGTNAWVGWTTSLGTVTNHYGRFYIWLTANPASAARLMSVYDAGVLVFTIQVNSTGKILGVDATGTAYTFANSIALGQLVRIEYHVVHSAVAGQHEIKLFNTAGSTNATEVQTSAATRNTHASGNEIRFGATDGGLSAITAWYDNIIANAASYPGPVPVLSGGQGWRWTRPTITLGI